MYKSRFSVIYPPDYVKKAAISSYFYYARQTNRTALHAVITMDGVRAGFAWSKKPVQLQILGSTPQGI